MEMTVLMPVYNGEKYLTEAIESILNQTFRNFEFLIINDGSTDSSEEIILSYKDKRIRYEKNNVNLKLIATLNKGIAMATGKYIVRMDADDISYPERLGQQYSFMENNPEVAICGSWFQSFGIDNSLTKYEQSHEDIMFKMLYQCHLCHPSLILRTSAIVSMEKMFDPEFEHAEDYDFFVRVGRQYQLANLGQVLIKYRTHGSNISVQYSAQQERNSTTIREREFNQLGYKIRAVELRDFIRLNYYVYNELEQDPSLVRAMLEGIYNANSTTHYFQDEFLHKKLSFLWYHYCYGRVQIDDFLKSRTLSSGLSLNTRIKWGIKRMISK